MSVQSSLRTARWVTLVGLAGAPATALVPTAVGVLRDGRPTAVALGLTGAVGVTVALAGALATAVVPASERTRRRLLGLLGVAILVSVPLLASAAQDPVPPWIWIGGSVVGAAPVLVDRRRVVWTAAAAVVAAAATAALATATSVWVSLAVLAVTAVAVGFAVVVPFLLWDAALAAAVGRTVHAELVAGQERLRLARDVHDHVGHRLTVIGLRAELVARTARADPARAASEAEQVVTLVQDALAEVRAAVHGYEAVPLPDRLAAVSAVLAESGVRCEAAAVPDDLPEQVAGVLAAVVLEAVTNVLRHSRATWCTIDVGDADDGWVMAVTNDGAGASVAGAPPDPPAGLVARLAAVGGCVGTGRSGDRYVLRVVVPGAP